MSAAVRLLWLSLLACVVPSAAVSQPLTADSGWSADQLTTLNSFLETHGSTSADYDSEHPPVAVFDWDNTVIKNDIGAATVRWMAEHGLVRQPPEADWRLANPHLVEAAVAYLTASCGTETPPGETLPASPSCREALTTLYETGRTPDGEAAFGGYDYRTYRGTTSFQSTLLAGYTPAEVRAMVDAVIERGLAAEVGAEGGYLRVNEPVRALIGAMQAAGIDVWVVSASPQYVVEPFAARVGVEADHVIGLRTVEQDGALTYAFQPCGTSAATGNDVIDYMEGKRCWINRVIFGVPVEQALERQAEPQRRVAFAAGDAPTDIAMLLDATGLRLVVDRHKTELMCHALNGQGTPDQGAPWLIVPMFYEPLGERGEPYACSTSGCVANDGSGVPCRDESGAVIPDQ